MAAALVFGLGFGWALVLNALSFVVVLLATDALAHHNMTALFDFNDRVTLNGTLAQVDSGNVKQLQLVWSWAMNEGATNEPTPLIHNGILYLANTGQKDIYTARADGTDLRQVTNTPDNEDFADWGTHSE